VVLGQLESHTQRFHANGPQRGQELVQSIQTPSPWELPLSRSPLCTEALRPASACYLEALCCSCPRHCPATGLSPPGVGLRDGAGFIFPETWLSTMGTELARVTLWSRLPHHTGVLWTHVSLPMGQATVLLHLPGSVLILTTSVFPNVVLGFSTSDPDWDSLNV
jgi:hypothetical protein